MNIKPFDGALFRANDPQARAVVKRYYEVYHGCTLHDHSDIYGVDLVHRDADGSIMFGVEVQRRGRFWHDGYFPDDIVWVPCRKERLSALPYDIQYVALNSRLTMGITADWAAITEQKIEAKVCPNNQGQQELFWLVPIQVFRHQNYRGIWDADKHHIFTIAL